jgi:hypothetical protein
MVYELCERGAVMDISIDKVATPYSESEARTFFSQLILGIEYCRVTTFASKPFFS